MRAPQSQSSGTPGGSRRWHVHVTGHGRCCGAGQGRGAGVTGDQLLRPGESGVCPQVVQQLLRRGETLVARSVRRDPVTNVGKRVVGQHETVGIERVSAEGGRRGVDAVDRVRRVH